MAVDYEPGAIYRRGEIVRDRADGKRYRALADLRGGYLPLAFVVRDLPGELWQPLDGEPTETEIEALNETMKVWSRGTPGA